MGVLQQEAVHYRERERAQEARFVPTGGHAKAEERMDYETLLEMMAECERRIRTLEGVREKEPAPAFAARWDMIEEVVGILSSMELPSRHKVRILHGVITEKPDGESET